jgi:type II secretory pathway component PulC
MLISAGSAAPEDEPFRIAGAKMEPVFEGGTPIGIRFSHILPDSCIAGLGIRNGDLLVELNDKPISSINDYSHFLEVLKEISPFSFQLRGEDGDTRTLQGKGCGLAPSGERA